MTTKSEHLGWYSRGYLPHFDSDTLPQSITIRLNDSLPDHVLEKMQEEAKADEDLEKQIKIEEYLDAGHGACWLQRPDCAQLMVDTLKFYDGDRYRLQDWVIMPNHAHVSYDQPHKPMGKILHGWRSYSANEINKMVGRTGRLWHRGFFDRYIRDAQHFFNVQCYIFLNPVKAGLVDDPFDWPWSSIHKHTSVRASLNRWYEQWKDEFWDVYRG